MHHRVLASLKHAAGSAVQKGSFIRSRSSLSHTRTTIGGGHCSGSSVRCFSVGTSCRQQFNFTAADLVDSNGVVRSPWAPIDIPNNVSFGDYLCGDFGKFGNKIALIDAVSGRKLSYNELHDSVHKVASALCRLGLRQGDVITISAPNSIEWAIMYLAGTVAGVTVSAVNPLYTAGELAHAVGHSKSKYVVTIKELAGVAQEAASRCPDVKEVIVFSEAEGCRPFSSLLADDGMALPDKLSVNPEEDTVVLPYSSGTTGLPKGVMLTHYNLIANIEQLKVADMVKYEDHDVLMGVLPFFHIYGQVLVLLSALKGGVTVVCQPKFDPELFLSSVQKYNVTFLHIVPPIVLFLAKHPMVPKFDYSSVSTLFVGAAPCGQEIIEGSLARINKNAVFRQGYGLTEASPVTHANPKHRDLIRTNTVGNALCNTEFKILDIETGATLGQGEEGELCVRGPQIMKGYFKNKDATDGTIIDGYLHTGDIGYYDDIGSVVITDRLKELIKVKGFQVAPAELEALLVTHPAIQDAAVIGKPDEKSGELPRAYVVKAPNQSISPEDVQSFVKENVAAFKVLAGGVEFVDEIPKSAAGKILRRVLKEELVSRI